MPSFVNVLVALGGILGLVVGLLQLYRWYWSGVVNAVRNALQRQQQIRFLYLKAKLGRLSHPNYVLEQAVRAAFVFVLGFVVMVLGLITSFTGSFELGLPPLVLQSGPVVDEYGRGNPLVLMILWGSRLAGAGLGFICISGAILYSIIRRPRHIDKLRHKIDQFIGADVNNTLVEPKAS